MAYNITLSRLQKFSVKPDDEPLYKPWSFNPESVLKLNYIIGEDLPAPIDILTTIKDYYVGSDASDVIVRAELTVDSGLVTWVVLSGEIFSGTPLLPISDFSKEGYVLTDDNKEVTNTLTFQNLELLTSGIYTGKITFSVLSVSADAALPKFMESLEYHFELDVTTGPRIYVDKDALVFDVFRKDVVLPTKNLAVSAEGVYKITTSPNLTITGPGVVDNSTTDATIVTAVGNTDLVIGLKDAVRTHPTNLIETQLVLTNAISTIYVDVTVNITESTVLVVTPSVLLFNAIIGFTEAAAQTFKVLGFGSYTIEVPDFITLSSYTGINTQTFTVTPLNAASLSPDTYTGNIIITSGGVKYYLPVTYIIEGSISTVLTAGNINFTKELDYVSVVNLTRDTANYVEVVLNIDVVNYKTLEVTTYQFPYKLPFFNHQLKWHIGEIVERLFAKPSGLTDFSTEKLSEPTKYSTPVFNPATVKAIIQIKNRTTGLVVEEKTLRNMRFLPGTKPINFSGNIGFLTASNHLKRVTLESFENVSFYVSSGSYVLNVLQNNKTVYSAEQTAVVSVNQHLIKFSDYNVGDTINVELVVNKIAYLKSYYITQNDNQSYHIAFVNQNKVLELFECTGDIVLTDDIQHTTHSYYKEFLNVLESLDSDEVKSISLNTGFIFQNNVAYVNAILRSPKVWLVFKNQTAIALIPKDKKIINYDSDQELYEYQMEFTINKAKDVEDYTF